MKAKAAKIITYVYHTHCRLHLRHQSGICESLPLSQRARVVSVTFDQTSPLKQIIQCFTPQANFASFSLHTIV